MQIYDAITDPGNEVNEDFIQYNNRYVLLMDGSTGLENNIIPGYKSDAVWFVNRAAEYIDYFEKKYVDFTDIIQNVISALNQEYNSFNFRCSRVQMPSASLVMIRENKNSLEILNLGDCTTLVEMNDGTVEVIHDSRVTDLDGKVMEKMKKISLEKHITIAQTKEYVMNDLIQNRSKKNREDGYQVLGFDWIAERDLEIYSYDKNTVKEIFSFSDGAAEHYETLKLSDSVYDFHDKMVSTDLRSILKEIRQRQETDLSCSLYPRLKVKDDVSMIVAKP